MTPSTALFLDTSIQIANRIHGPKTRKRISQRLESSEFVCSSLVVRAEFKRRFLKECAYLRRKFEECNWSFQDVRYALSLLPPQQGRKHRICLDIVNSIDPDDTDADRAERAKHCLDFMLKHELTRFDRKQYVFPTSGCAFGKSSIGYTRGRHDFGSDRCHKTNGSCGIEKFLIAHKTSMQTILSHLKALPLGSMSGEKTRELQAAESFLEFALANPQAVESRDPCTTVGDLIIALESAFIPSFYTMNEKESIALCQALGQQLIVRPKNPAHDDRIVEYTK